MAKTVLLTGDLLQQVNLVSEQIPPHKCGGPLPGLRVESLQPPGGSLAALVAAACSDLKPRILTAGSHTAAGQSYVLWSPFPREPEKNDKADADQVWRICRHLGVVQPNETLYPPPEAATHDPHPDVLLIDDLGLGFRDDSGHWPQALRDGGRPERIILKCGAPLVPGASGSRAARPRGLRLAGFRPAGLSRAET